jgi:capsular polysaccharide biosynthesis protein
MQTTGSVQTLTLTELGTRLASRWRVLMIGLTTGLLAGVGVLLVLPPRYAATTVLLVDAPEPTRIDMTAEVAIASSRRVTAEAVDALDTPELTVSRLEAATVATSVDGSRLLRITCSVADPQTAARGADAVAQAYLAVRSVDASLDDGRSPIEASVVDPARPPQSTVGPGSTATLVGATLLGLIVAATVAGRPTRTRAAPAS